MRFTEINLFGVYVAPVSVIMVAAWLATIWLRWGAARFGLLRYVWHPALFVFAVYMIVFSSMVLLIPWPILAETARRIAPNAPVADRLGAPAAASRPRSRIRLLPVVITLIAVAAAVALGQAMWDIYMDSPWTRDGTVRVYAVTMAPQVAGQIVELPVADNQFVHRGDLLMAIDPTNYKIALQLAEAAVQKAKGRRTTRRSSRTDARS